MAQLIALDRLAAPQRLPTWRDAVCDTFVRLECSTPRGELSHGRLQAGVLGDLHVARVQSSQQEVVRTPFLVSQASEAFVLMSLQARGKTVVQQGGREAVLTPGSLSFYDTSRPYRLGLPGDFDQIVLQVPRDEMVRLAPLGLGNTAMLLNAHNPYAQALFALAPQLMQLSDAPVSELTLRTARTAIDLMGLALASLGAEPSEARLGEQTSATVGSANSEALWRRTRELIWQQIDDPELSAARLAEQVRVSLRRLQEVFKAHETTLSDCLWELRLEHARSMLVSPSYRHQSVTLVAYNSGFSDIAHFSRRFKARFGMGPREYREHKEAAG
jgi:AraC-like DNA-binding protein